MGPLQQRITSDMKTALKAGDKLRLGVLRLLIAAFKDHQLKQSVDELDEAQELALLQKAVKACRAAVAQAEELGRADVADSERAEIEVIEDYLPAMMSPEELGEKVQDLATEIGYQGPAETGRFMKEWMARYKGRAEGRDVQAAIKALSTA